MARSPRGWPATRLGANGWSIGRKCLRLFQIGMVWARRVSKSIWRRHALNGGMQLPPGHRQNIHNPDFREVGIGNVIAH